MRALSIVALLAIVGAFATVASLVSVKPLSLALIRLPKPAGVWPIGRTTIALGGGPTDIWYPIARTTRGRFARYGTIGSRSIKQRVAGRLIVTSAILDAPPAEGCFPTTVFLPGWNGTRESNTMQIQNLASNGFIVAAIDDRHPAAEIDFSSDAALATSVGRAERKLDAQVGDVVALIDDLARLDRERSSLHGRLDLSNLGVVGFSFGGAVAAESARRDPRLRVAVNLDGYMYGGAYRSSVARPFLYLSTIDGPPRDTSTLDDQARRTQAFEREQSDRIYAGLRRSGGYYVAIEGSEHSSFSDAAGMPFWLGGVRAKLDGTAGARLIGTCIVNFLDRSLRRGRTRQDDVPCASPIAHVLAASSYPTQGIHGEIVRK